MNLKWKLVIRSSIAASVFGVLVFVPAGSLRFWEGWIFLAIWVVPTVAGFGYFYKHDPALVERRLRRGETVGEQKIIMKLMFVVLGINYILPGFDHRFGWSHPPVCDFWRAVSYDSPSHVFGDERNASVHAAGAGVVRGVAGGGSAHPDHRFSSAQRGKGAAPGTAWLCRILPAHSIPAGAALLVRRQWCGHTSARKVP